jgi:hypothetical protein
VQVIATNQDSVLTEELCNHAANKEMRYDTLKGLPNAKLVKWCVGLMLGEIHVFLR